MPNHPRTARLLRRCSYICFDGSRFLTKLAQPDWPLWVLLRIERAFYALARIGYKIEILARTAEHGDFVRAALDVKTEIVRLVHQVNMETHRALQEQDGGHA